MSEELYARIVAYRQAMAMAKAMLRRGIISERDYAEIDTIMTKKYGLYFGTIFR